MKLAKNILVLMCAGAMMMGSTERVNALGGTYGMWSDDVTDAGMFPHHMTKWNTAWTDNGDDVNAFWKDGESTTTWGFGFGTDTDEQHDLMNMMWGNGTYGVTFGVNMIQEVLEVEGVTAVTAGCTNAAGDTDVVAADEAACLLADGTNLWTDTVVGVDAVEGIASGSAIDLGFGMAVAGGDLGFFYGTGNGDMALNFRKPMNLWLFDQMMINFNMYGEEAVAMPMAFNASFWKITPGENGHGLFGMGVRYADYETTNWTGGADMDEAVYAADYCVAGVDDDEDPTACNDALYLDWNFAMETPMKDWATFRVGFNKGFDLMNMAGTALAPSMGLGFDYGGFNLDMSVEKTMFNDPVKYFWGRNAGTLTSSFSISYNW